MAEPDRIVLLLDARAALAAQNVKWAAWLADGIEDYLRDGGSLDAALGLRPPPLTPLRACLYDAFRAGVPIPATATRLHQICQRKMNCEF